MNSRRLLGVALSALGCAAVPAWPQSLSQALAIPVEVRLDMADVPERSMPLWKVRSDATRSYERNPAVWTGPSVQLTGKAVWNSRSQAFGTTAVSPLHVVYAHHVVGLYPVGTVVRFVGAENATVERSVVASVRIGSSDVDLSTFDVPLPATIHWFRVMPEHWFLKCSRQIPGIRGGLPCVVMDGNTESIEIADLSRFFVGGFAAVPPLDPHRLLFARVLRSGDSGSPMLLLLGNELVLDGMFSTAQSGPEFGSMIGELDAAMQPAGAQLSVVDLSEFRAP